jgi:hypothetical protein
MVVAGFVPLLGCVFASVRSEGSGWWRADQAGLYGRLRRAFFALLGLVGGFFVPLTTWVRDGQVAVP